MAGVGYKGDARPSRDGRPKTLEQIRTGSGQRDMVRLQPIEMAKNIRDGIRAIRESLDTPGTLRENTDREKAIAVLAKKTLETLSEQFELHVAEPSLVAEIHGRFVKTCFNKGAVSTTRFIGNVVGYYDARAKGRQMTHEGNIVRDIFEVFHLYGGELYSAFPEAINGAHLTKTLVRIKRTKEEEDADRSMNALRKERARVRGRRVMQVAYPLFDKLASFSMTDLPEEMRDKLSDEDKSLLINTARLAGLRFKRLLGERLADIIISENLGSNLSKEEREKFVDENLDSLVSLTDTDKALLAEWGEGKEEDEVEERRQGMLRDKWDQLGHDMTDEDVGTGTLRQNNRIRLVYHDAYMQKLDTVDRALNGLVDDGGKWGLMSPDGTGIRYGALIRHVYQYMLAQKGEGHIGRGENFIKTFGGYIGVRSLPKAADSLQSEIDKEETVRAELGDRREEAHDEAETDPKIMQEIESARMRANTQRKNFSETFYDFLVPVMHATAQPGFPITEPMIGELVKCIDYLKNMLQTNTVILECLERHKSTHEQSGEQAPTRLNAAAIDSLFVAYGSAKGVAHDAKKVITEAESLLTLPVIKKVLDEKFAGSVDEVRKKYKNFSRVALMAEATGPLTFKDDGTMEGRVYETMRQVDALVKRWEIPSKKGDTKYKLGWKSHVSKFYDRASALLTRIHSLSSLNEQEKKSMYVVLAKEHVALRGELENFETIRDLADEFETLFNKKFPGQGKGMMQDGLDILAAMYVDPRARNKPRPVSEVIALFTNVNKNLRGSPDDTTNN